jgi:hypothetical protein
MIYATAGEMPAEPVSPVPAPEATAELEDAPPQAAALDGLAPAPDEPVAASSSAAAPAADRAMPEIDYPVGPVRQAILDHFIDSEGDQSMAQIKAALPNVLPGTVEACVRREWGAGRIERVAPGVYRLAPAKPPEPPKPAPSPEPVVRSDGHTDEEWLAWLGDWRAGGKWEGPGNPPGHPGCVVPPGAVAKHNDAVRKRAERQREREAATARQAAADRELRDKLIAATGGNIIRTSALDDLAPIKLAMQVVPLDRILSAIRSKTDKKLFPGNEPVTSWRAERLLREIADSYCRTDIVPRLVDAWSKAGKAPTPGAQSSPPTGEMPDDHIDRSCHDQENAPSGPHVMPQPPMDEDAGAAPSVAPDVSANAADASDAPPAVSAPLES